MAENGKKRLFLSLILGSAALYVLVFLSIWFIIGLNSALLNKILMIALLSVCVLMTLFVAVGMGFLVLALLSVDLPPWLGRFSRHMVDFFSPAVFHLAKLMGISEEAVGNSYIKMVNQLNTRGKVRFDPQEVLVLVPHCLQKADCPHKITTDVTNCHRCGRCSISGILAISEERGVRLAVASGGTFARKTIRDNKPKAVVAVACQRDLLSGMHDITQIPIIGVLNERPNGPCYNTTVELCKINQALDNFLAD